jgi:hypothetical protein
MMSDLVRLDCDDQGVMHPHSDGDWCDYSEAQAEIERLRAELFTMRNVFHQQDAEIERLEAAIADAYEPGCECATCELHRDALEDK